MRICRFLFSVTANWTFWDFGPIVRLNKQLNTSNCGKNVMAMFHYSLKCYRPNGQLIKWERNWQLDGCSQHNISPTWQTWGIGNWNECWPSQLLLFHFIVELTPGTASGMPHDVLTKGSWHVSPTFKSSMTPGVTLGHWKVFLWALLLKWQRRSWTMSVLSGGTVKLYFMEADRSENQIKLELSAWLDTTRANWGEYIYTVYCNLGTLDVY